MPTKAVLDRLYRLAACHLCLRKDVQVRFRMPSAKNSDGFACLDKLGLPLIEIRPDMTEERTLFCFLHECAHVRMHAKSWLGNPQVSAFMDDLPNNVESPRDYFYRLGLKTQYDFNEDEADKLANSWLEYAVNNEDIYGGERLERMLKAVAAWSPPLDIERAVKIAERAGQKAAQERIEFEKWKLEQLRIIRDYENITLEEWKKRQMNHPKYANKKE